MTVSGTVTPGFEPVRAAFERNFAEHGDLGAAVAIYRDGQPVVDLWGGVADPEHGRAWEPDTVALVYSATKGVLAAAAHLLVERGQLDLDLPVAHYWPEFAAAGKGAIPVRWLLSHQAGLPALDEAVPLEDALRWEPMVKAEEIAGPLGADFFIGLPESERHRVARLIFAPKPEPGGVSLADVPEEFRPMFEAMQDPAALINRAFQVTDPADPDFDSARVQAAEIPSSNGIGTARGLARIYAALIGEVDGTRLLSPDTLADAVREQAAGIDRVMLLPDRYASGYMLPDERFPLGGPSAFGHPGRGGSLGFADPARGLSFAYITNYIIEGAPDPRALGLVTALNELVN